ncbi:Glycoside hydrolase family 16 protein [Ceratobasidium theobromae]|uniref:Glycoside hydrolase family 16 protein n=1 Tax=Ceratobasidium theobromae TaxID=1582974 RepID=A0A5N5QNN1_9AGAM|nr:Glycoside hydrolase family 16 protein [Ceratobasidium theobromae]
MSETSSARRRRKESEDTPGGSQSTGGQEDEARRDFLERNKLAARRHRERRKGKCRGRVAVADQLDAARQELDARRAQPHLGGARIGEAAARVRLEALGEVYGRAVRSCDDPIPIHCDARFRALLAAAEDAAAPIRSLVLECEELSKTCVDASQ